MAIGNFQDPFVGRVYGSSGPVDGGRSKILAVDQALRSAMGRTATEDDVQDILLDVLESWSTADDVPEAVRPVGYYRRALKNRYAERVRGQILDERVKVLIRASSRERRSCDPATNAMFAEDAALVWRAMNRLPEDERVLLMQVYICEGTRRGAVESPTSSASARLYERRRGYQRLCRARRHLRTNLIGLGFDAGEPA